MTVWTCAPRPRPPESSLAGGEKHRTRRIEVFHSVSIWDRQAAQPPVYILLKIIELQVMVCFGWSSAVAAGVLLGR